MQQININFCFVGNISMVSQINCINKKSQTVINVHLEIIMSGNIFWKKMAECLTTAC
jgi:hypothetical protein